MSYKNARDVLPSHVLCTIQQYIDGEYLYIPRLESGKKPWGANTETKKRLRDRNDAILRKRRMGCSVEELAAEYFLSAKAIYKIINTGQDS